MYTLVLNSELQSLKSQMCSSEELLVRVSLSGWMQRTWIFYEDISASMKILILFADDPSKLPLALEDNN